MTNGELENESEGNKAFSHVYDKQGDLQELLNTGGEADEDTATSLAAIKSAGQELLNAVNSLSLADFEEEFAEAEDDSNPLDADTLENIFQ